MAITRPSVQYFLPGAGEMIEVVVLVVVTQSWNISTGIEESKTKSHGQGIFPSFQVRGRYDE
jgi:hypothetical protein